MRLLNDVDIDGDYVYFIDSSYKRGVNDAVQEILESFPLGRLFRLNEITNELLLFRKCVSICLNCGYLFSVPLNRV